MESEVDSGGAPAPTGERLAKLEAAVELLTANARPARRWFQEPAILISGAAFTFSLLTTSLSFYQARQAEVRSLKTELRQLSQRITVLPRENLDALARFQADPQSLSNFTGQVAQETMLLANQANEIITELPANEIKPTEQITVAWALISNYRVADGMKLLDAAVAGAKDPQNRANALRVRGNTYFGMGQSEKGRQDYLAAIQAFETQKAGFNPGVLAQTFAFTKLSWASAEMSAGNYAEAEGHLKDAEARILELPDGPLKQMLTRQVEQTRMQMATPVFPVFGPEAAGPSAQR